MAEGRKTGGRKAGTPNKSTLTVRERIAKLGGDPVAYLVATMRNIVPCATCRGEGKTKFQPAGSTRFQGIRTCQSCWGSKLEKISPNESADAARTLMDYIAPRLKAIEHTGADGGPIEHEHIIRLVE